MDYVEANIRYWESRREDQRRLARRQWAATEPTWGNFGVPEAVAGVLPAELRGARTVELGCGTGYVSAWLARRGAVPIAVDPTPGQLGTARQLQDEHRLWFPLVVVLRDHGENICDAMLQAVHAPVTLRLTAMTVGLAPTPRWRQGATGCGAPRVSPTRRGSPATSGLRVFAGDSETLAQLVDAVSW